jgi:hypothetical protein
MIKEAFVYCWTDHRTNMLYVGSHKGTIDDDYICSSKHMMKEYKERPEDFTRKIIAEGELHDIRVLEGKILKAVGARLNENYYNKHENDGLFFGGWKHGTHTEEHKKNMSIAASKRKRTKEHLEALWEGRRKSKNSKEHILALKTMDRSYMQTAEWTELMKKTSYWKNKKRSEEDKKKILAPFQKQYKCENCERMFNLGNLTQHKPKCKGIL